VLQCYRKIQVKEKPVIWARRSKWKIRRKI